MRRQSQRFQSVLCAVDFSPHSSAVLQTATRIASKSGGHLSVLCVDEPLLGQGAAAVGYDTAALRKSTVDALRRLTRRIATRGKLPADAWSVDTVLGQPAPAIVSYARKKAADLIVMGTSGRRGPAKLFFGSSAEAVLRRAPAPVLVVPKGAAVRASRNGHALGAIELGPHAARDARRMSRAARDLDLSLTLLHVVPVTPGPPWSAPLLAAKDRARLTSARTSLERLARSTSSRGRVVLGHPDEEIPAVAVDARASAIVLVLRRGHGLFGRRQGTTTYRVLGSSKVPVLALPPV